LATITAAKRCSLKREAFWNGNLEAGFFATEQQLKSGLACIWQSGWDEGFGFSACLLSRGQQLWREGEDSGLGAGGDPAGATTAARDGKPAHAATRWLTDQPSSATIRTTPVYRLLDIAVAILDAARGFICDWSHNVLYSLRGPPGPAALTPRRPLT
jgi:hypothetical protein